METVRQIYRHDVNYTDETNWLSKKDVLEKIDERIKELKEEIKKYMEREIDEWVNEFLYAKAELNKLKQKITG